MPHQEDRFIPLHPNYIDQGLRLGVSKAALSEAHLPIQRDSVLEGVTTHLRHHTLLNAASRHRGSIVVAMVAVMCAIACVTGVSVGWWRLSTVERTARILPSITARETAALDNKIGNLAQVVATLVKELKRSSPAPEASAPSMEALPAPIPARHARTTTTTGVVSVKRASLHREPTSTSEAVMHLPQGTRVLVEGKEGDWVRIVSPRGTAAFVLAKSVSIR